MAAHTARFLLVKTLFVQRVYNFFSKNTVNYRKLHTRFGDFWGIQSIQNFRVFSMLWHPKTLENIAMYGYLQYACVSLCICIFFIFVPAEFELEMKRRNKLSVAACGNTLKEDSTVFDKILYSYVLVLKLLSVCVGWWLSPCLFHTQTKSCSYMRTDDLDILTVYLRTLSDQRVFVFVPAFDRSSNLAEHQRLKKWRKKTKVQ